MCFSLEDKILKKNFYRVVVLSVVEHVIPALCVIDIVQVIVVGIIIIIACLLSSSCETIFQFVINQLSLCRWCHQSCVFDQFVLLVFYAVAFNATFCL